MILRDIRTLEFFIKGATATPQIKKELAADLYKMVRYCEDLYNCRRVTALEYFGEEFDRVNCRGLCDNCQANRTPTLRNLTVEAQLIVKYSAPAKCE